MNRKVLLVDDDAQSLDSTRKILELAGYDVTVAGDGEAALELARPQPGHLRAPFDAVVTDVRMPKLGGLEFLRALSLFGAQAPAMPVILMTAYGRVEDAVWAMKLGAVDFLSKPFKRQALLAAVEGAIKRMAPATGRLPDTELVGHSAAIAGVRALIAQVAPTAATVLVTGESGTGKELVARALHNQSARAGGPFVALNCAAVPEQLIESELFGFEKGAFTGAAGAKAGLFEAAHGGTLLLDEIGDMPLALQAKLLRVLQEGETRRLGATASRRIDVRVVAATHRDLHGAARSGAFREDLLYRLEVIGLRVPSLRERLEDVPDLAWHFLRLAAGRHSKAVTALSEPAMEALLAHAWPGNIRELSNVIERGVVFAQGTELEIDDLPPHLASLVAGAGLAEPLARGSISVPIGTSLRAVEDLMIRRTLEATAGDKNLTARLLGINSRTIYRKLDERKPAKEPDAPDGDANPS